VKTRSIPIFVLATGLALYTRDYNPGGTTERDESSCSVVTGLELQRD